MKPTMDVPLELLENGSQFADPYFAALQLSRAKDPLLLEGRPKHYLFPTLYGDVRCAVAIFHCDRVRAERLAAEALGVELAMPRLLKGRSIVALSCYEYRRVRGVRPYNEIALALPVNLDGKPGLPVLGAFAGGPDSGYYIAGMPVTSEENRRRGRHFWNLPKETRRIDIEEAEGLCRVRSYAADGGLDLALEVPTRGKAKSFDVRSFLATRKDGALMRSPTAFRGEFAVNLRAATLWGGKPGAPALELGKGELSAILREIGAEDRPLQTRYAASMNSWFDLPEGAKEERT